MKKKKIISVEKWVEETFKKYRKFALEEPWICLFLTQRDLKNKGKWYS